MRICWDNLEKLQYNKKKGCWIKKSPNKRTKYFFYKESCKKCGEPFLFYTKHEPEFCSSLCALKGRNLSNETKKKLSQAMLGRYKGSNNPNFGGHISKELRKKMIDGRRGKYKGEKCHLYGKHLSEETKRKMKESRKNYHLSEETKKKIGESQKGRNHWRWANVRGVIPLFDTYASQIDWCEKVRRDPEDKIILQVKCTYCGKWYRPILRSVVNRIRSIYGKNLGENRLYCSDECKDLCPIYGKIKYSAEETNTKQYSREAQAELRQLVFERDGWVCIKCGSTCNLQCHHIEGIKWNPLESADIDACVTLCKTCHEEVHRQKGCEYQDLKCKGGINV